MNPTVNVLWSLGAHQTRNAMAVLPGSIADQVKAGMKVIGSEAHGIILKAAPPVGLSDVPASDLPVLEHDAVYTPEIQEELEDLVILPSLDDSPLRPLVIFHGMSGSGKTTAKMLCVAEIARRCDQRIAYMDLPAAFFRRGIYGESEGAVRYVFDNALELGRQGYIVVVAFEDAEATLQSREWSRNSMSGCGATASATTSELLHGLDRLREARIRVTMITSTNYPPSQLDPAVTAAHRLRGCLYFPPLDLSLVPQVVDAHAPQFNLAQGVREWLVGTFSARTILAKGTRDRVRCEVVLQDCLTPSVIAGVLNRAKLKAGKGPITVEHAARAFAADMALLARKIADHARAGGDIGMIVPGLADAGGLSLSPAFDADGVVSQAALDAVLAPA